MQTESRTHHRGGAVIGAMLGAAVIAAAGAVISGRPSAEARDQIALAEAAQDRAHRDQWQGVALTVAGGAAVILGAVVAGVGAAVVVAAHARARMIYADQRGMFPALTVRSGRALAVVDVNRLPAGIAHVRTASGLPGVRDAVWNDADDARATVAGALTDAQRDTTRAALLVQGLAAVGAHRADAPHADADTARQWLAPVASPPAPRSVNVPRLTVAGEARPMAPRDPGTIMLTTTDDAGARIEAPLDALRRFAVLAGPSRASWRGDRSVYGICARWCSAQGLVERDARTGGYRWRTEYDADARLAFLDQFDAEG